MENLGFEQGAEDTVSSVLGNSNGEGTAHWSCSTQLLRGSNGCDETTRETSSQPKETSPNTSSPKPKNKYRRILGSFSYSSRVPNRLGKMLDIPSKEGVRPDDIKFSSFFVSQNNNNNIVSKTAKCQEYCCENGTSKEVHCSISNPVRSNGFWPNDKSLCSSQNFQEHLSVSSLLNNAQESSSYTTVPSLTSNNNYHDEYLNSMPPFSITSLNPHFSNKHNLICDTALDAHKEVVQPPKTTNKYSNLDPSQTFLNNAQCSGISSSYLKNNKDDKFSKKDAQLNLLACTVKSPKEVNHVSNRSNTLPAVRIKNMKNQNQESTTGIPTVSGTLPMYYSRLVDRAVSLPNPCQENIENVSKSSGVLAKPLDTKETLQLLCVLLLMASFLALIATGHVLAARKG
jgi:hypothetical protein